MNCPYCGAPIPENGHFCPACGASMPQTPAEPPKAADPEAAAASETFVPEAPTSPEPLISGTPFAADGELPVVPVPVKKSRKGLVIAIIVAAALIIGVLAAGFCTDWFGLAKKGPLDELQELCDNTLPEDTQSVTAKLHLYISGVSFDVELKCAKDADEPTGYVLYASTELFGNSIIAALYHGEFIIGSGDDISAAKLPKDMSAYGELQPLKQNGRFDSEGFFRQLLDEEVFAEMADEVDFAELDEALLELENKFNDEQWMQKFFHYSRTEDGEETAYHIGFTMDGMKEILKMIWSANKDSATTYEDAVKEMEDLTLADDAIQFDYIAENGKLSSITVVITDDGQKIKLSATFEDINSTEIDIEELEDLLSRAEHFDEAFLR